MVGTEQLMILTGTVKNSELLKNRDSENTARMLQVQFSNESDIQSVQYMPLSGDDNPPQVGDRVIVLALGAAFKVAIAVDDGLTPSMSAGERKLYSRDSAGDIAAFINLLNGGTIELNGNNDFAVRFTALETALQSLITQVNATFATKLNGSGAAGVVAVDFSPAKVDEVKIK